MAVHTTAGTNQEPSVARVAAQHRSNVRDQGK